MKLHAKYTDGEFYPANVVSISDSAKRKKAPVKVAYVGFDGSDAWLPLESLKSKKLPKAKEEKTAAKAKPKAKAKAKATVEYDYSGLEKGMKLQVEAAGTYYAAEVVTVSKKGKKDAPVKINFVGYTKDSDEWVGGDRIRSKALKKVAPKAKAKAKTKPADGSKPKGMPPAARKYLLVKPKVVAPLDPKFSPLILGKKKYLEAMKEV